MSSSRSPLRFLRLWLLPLLLILLPLHGGAAEGARDADASAAQWVLVMDADAGFDTGPAPDDERPLLAESGDTFPSGADLAEQLLPPSGPRFAPIRACGAPPAYAGVTLPDPDLPRLPRPPRG